MTNSTQRLLFYVWLTLILVSLSACGSGGSTALDTDTSIISEGNITDDVAIIESQRTFAEIDRLASPAKELVVTVANRTDEFAANGTERSISYTDDAWSYALTGGSGFYADNGGFGAYSSIPTDGESIIVNDAGFIAQLSTDGRVGILMDIPGDTIDEGLFEYTQYGAWAMTEGRLSFGESIVDMAAFTRGVGTLLDDLPGSGTATFSGYALGHETSDGILIESLVGTAGMSVDFNQRQFIGNLNFVDQPGWGLVTFIDGQFPNGVLEATLLSDVGHTGFASGQFNGPNAEEIGGVFHLTGPSQAIGGFGLIRDN